MMKYVDSVFITDGSYNMNGQIFYLSVPSIDI